MTEDRETLRTETKAEKSAVGPGGGFNIPRIFQLMSQNKQIRSVTFT